MSQTFRIGELCQMVRGESPTMKTEPGEYPLVVTAAYRRSSSTYQIEGPSVCIPLVSSTGHGDAAIHRVHYQDGKFALADLLIALLPRNSSCCDAKYLYYLLQAKKDALLVPLMKGTANVSLKERDIADALVTLPSIVKQKDVVEMLDSLSEKINEGKRLMEETSEDFEVLCRSILSDSKWGDPSPTPMSELVSLRSPDVFVEPTEVYQFAGVYCFGRGVFVGQHKSGMDFQYPRLTRLRTDNFVYPKLMAWEGALAVVPPECDGLVVSTEFPVFEIDQSKVLPEVLDVHFRTPSVWPALSGASTGTNVRRKRLNPADFLKYQIPLPSMESQQRLREIRSKLRGVTQGRVETIKELDAMLPAILHSVFDNGEQGEAV